ncbi:MAG TPA: N-6 DNA methylase [Nocardioides sp.]|uniref:Eco57I restriction-modification methylase domain-containing protein n=1 Tax=Nocardioides sp. TaxID=35761 RepID=UPI002ED8DAE0
MSTKTTSNTGANAARLSAVRVVGGLLPNDVVTAVLAGTIDGLRGSDYHLGSETPREGAARAWTHLLATYRRFREDLDALPVGDAAVAVTRERWLGQVFADLGYGRVPATPAGGLTAGEGATTKHYLVSHLWGSTPIHQLGWGVDLDRRNPGVAGAARAPHAMVQELLNRTDEYLWAILSNGRTLRLLRDSTTLTGFAYVEFDLEAMFDGELFAEFALMYLLVHESRVEIADGASPASCWLERWRTTAIGRGVRALTLLREGVETALETLGTGFLQHPANTELRQSLADGIVRLSDVHAALLRMVYRLLFWAVAEDRDALLAPSATTDQRDRYQTYFSSARLRDLALKRHGSGHDDLWQAARLVLDALGRSGGEPRLGLPALGGLFTITAQDVLTECRLPNTALLSAVRSLSVVQPKGEPRRVVDFAHLGAEELGSVYESLLELVPRYDPVSHSFSLKTLAGNDRKTTGSYYTPSELVELVLDTALEPVLDDVEKRTKTSEERAEALLALKVCDPAVGSAHFLVAAARRIALRLAVARTDELDPTPTDYSNALHDVVGSCLYGVDLNPMAADLAKVSLWLTAMTPGKPLSFLDHHIKVGNGLLGATPALLRHGVPDAAFTALTGDDKAEVARWKKANKAERANRGGDDLFSDSTTDLDPVHARTITTEVDQALRTAASLDEVTFAAQRYATLSNDPETQRRRHAADAWCAAFLGEKTCKSIPFTTAVVDSVAAGSADGTVLDAVRAIAARFRLFHWHLEFPEVFRIPDNGPAGGTYGWSGGFDAMLGNPPWERVKLQEQEFFATRAEDVSAAKNATARKKAIAALENSERHALFVEFNEAKRRSEAESHFLRESGAYPLCGRGDVNRYSVFVERARGAISTRGRAGMIVPSGLLTTDTLAEFSRTVLTGGQLRSFFDFANHKRGLFSGLKGQSWFCLATLSSQASAEPVRLAFDLAGADELHGKVLTASSEAIGRMNPNSGTLTTLRDQRSVSILEHAYEATPILVLEGRENPWGLQFFTMFHMANDSGVFVDAEDLERGPDDRDDLLPLLEGKMLWLYNNRHGTYAGLDLVDGKGVRALPRPTPQELADPNYRTRPRYAVPRSAVDGVLDAHGWKEPWLMGFRDVTNTTNQRTFILCASPVAGVGHKFPLIKFLDPSVAPRFQALASSLMFDWLVRQKLTGTSMSYMVVRQVPMPSPRQLDSHSEWLGEPVSSFVERRVMELAVTSSEMLPYVASFPSCASLTTPFVWDERRRGMVIAELEAFAFHAYGASREDVEFIMESFSGFRASGGDEASAARQRVLRAFDRMAVSMTAAGPYLTELNPPPGSGPRHPQSAPEAGTERSR